MDTPTHILAGILAGEAAFRTRLGRAAPIVAGIAALIPDLDAVPARLSGDPLAGLWMHRGISHSLIFLPIASAVVAAVACLVARDKRFHWFFLAALAGMACQPLLDVPTNYGTQLLWPWSHERFALDWIFIIDPYLTCLIVVALVVSWLRIRRGQDFRGVAVRGLVLAAVYILALGSFHHVAFGRLGRELDARSLRSQDVGQLACLPVPLVPLAWNALYTTADGRDTHLGIIWIMRPGTLAFETIRGAADSPAIRAFKTSPQGRAYLWFARFPVFEEEDVPPARPGQEGEKLVRVYDLRFRSHMPAVARAVFGVIFPWRDEFRKPFLVEARISPQGQVLSIRLTH